MRSINRVMSSNYLLATQEVSMMRPIPFRLLAPGRQACVLEAHRMRSAVVAGLIRGLVRWVSAASR
jgi:hypothetical protein